MITKTKLIEGINIFVDDYLDKISVNNPAVCFMKPLATRAIKKKLNGADKFIDMIADDNGNIDVSNILSEMAESLMKVNEFTVNVPMIGDVLIGGGKIELGIPFINKAVVFKDTDINYLKELLTSS
jgi:mannose/fructose/N-acetylgalactosamine-specific phosphotransferase system component IIB